MAVLSQSPTDPGFVQNPYAFYAGARALGPLHLWEDYGMPTAFSHDLVHRLLRDRRFGRECPPDEAEPAPAHVSTWAGIEAHSMLDAEPPRHTRLRGLVLRAFTSRRIAALAPGIEATCLDLIASFPAGPFNLIDVFCAQVPVLTIARLLGVPQDMAPQLLDWSHAMVAMYQAGRDRAIEDAAEAASVEFSAFLRDYIAQRRAAPSDDLISLLIAAEAEGDRLSADELVTTCILLLNAGHEATVHAMGNAVKCLLEFGTPPEALSAGAIEATVEELLRFDPPLHMFTRYAYEPVTIAGHDFARGDQVALLLGAACRDPDRWPDPDRFDPARKPLANTAFGGGIHFCVGAPLARLEMQISLPLLFSRCPGLRLAEPPRYADIYHFHGLSRLMVEA